MKRGKKLVKTRKLTESQAFMDIAMRFTTVRQLGICSAIEALERRGGISRAVESAMYNRVSAHVDVWRREFHDNLTESERMEFGSLDYMGFSFAFPPGKFRAMRAMACVYMSLEAREEGL